MKRILAWPLLACGLASLIGLWVVPSSATAAYPPARILAGPVFVQTDNLSGNAIVAYDRGATGALTQVGEYPTQGLGGMLQGSAADHTASQDALTYDAGSRTLYAVNAGSNTISAFRVSADHLQLVQVVSSGGTFPVSIAVHGDVVYVLNALNGGSVQGYLSLGGYLVAVPGWNRSLGLNPTLTPQFVNTPGEVLFTPDGSNLIVTTKSNGNDIDVFHLGWLGTPSATPVVNSEPGQLPFGAVFDAGGHLVVAEAGTDSVQSFSVSQSGVLTSVQQVGTGQKATCWIVGANGYFYASNAGSGDVSTYADSGNGALSGGATTVTDPGTVDAAVSGDGHNLYVQTGTNGIVDEFSIGAAGSLQSIGSVVVPGGAGGEGIVAP